MRRFIVATAAVASLLASAPSAAPVQLISGLQANWKDLETWSHLVESSQFTELGLGLQPTGGAVLALLGRLSVRDPRVPPPAIRVQLAVGFMANPNLTRTRTLTFLADGGSKTPKIIDVSGGVIADDGSPGGIIQNGLGQLPAADFIRIAQAKTLTGNILGFDVVFTPEQLRAMRAFAARLHLDVDAAPSPR